MPQLFIEEWKVGEEWTPLGFWFDESMDNLIHRLSKTEGTSKTRVRRIKTRAEYDKLDKTYICNVSEINGKYIQWDGDPTEPDENDTRKSFVIYHRPSTGSYIRHKIDYTCDAFEMIPTGFKFVRSFDITGKQAR